jgi:hypothetical protein
MVKVERDKNKTQSEIKKLVDKFLGICHLAI